MNAPRRVLPEAPSRRGWCPSLARPMPTGDGLLARVHPPLGRLTTAQLRHVAEAARRFGNGHVDVTARANLQVRGVTEASRCALADALTLAGLGDVRADGGPQRLTLTSPLAGLAPEAIDVPALAEAIEAAGRLVAGLPAKALVAVEGDRFGLGESGADLRLAAAGPGRVAIAVATPGGLRPAGTVAEADAAALAASLLGALARSGHRRMRDFAGDPERDRILGGLRAAEHPDLPAHLPPLGRITLAPDLPLVGVEAPFGRCTADQLEALAAAAGADGVRVSPARGFLLARPGDRALADLAAAGFITEADDPRRAVAACPGAPACRSGSTPTLEDAARLADAFRPLAARGRRAHVSGCAKGCAQPGAADLTLVGHEGRYGIVPGGPPGAEPATYLTFEAALERVRRAAAAPTSDRSLADAFRNPT
ncbi:precorrin-3B synthase [Methylobacterium sp. A54F]